DHGSRRRDGGQRRQQNEDSPRHGATIFEAAKPALYLRAMPEKDAAGEALPAPRLRDAAVAPAKQSIAEMLERLPAAPGVYIMKDRRGKPVYIGKAAVLRNRVRQYFQASSSDNRDFVPLLEGIVADIETVITSNEKEAL